MENERGSCCELTLLEKLAIDPKILRVKFFLILSQIVLDTGHLNAGSPTSHGTSGTLHEAVAGCRSRPNEHGLRIDDQ